MAEKLVQQQGNYETVSWMKSDVTYYGIREIGSSTFLSTYAPTPDLKGWPLRKAVEADLMMIASQVRVPEEVKLPEDYIPEGLRGKVATTMRIPTVCWNPPKRMSRRCDICHYSWMCRIPIKMYPPKGSS